MGISVYDDNVCRILNNVGCKNVGISLLGGMIVDVKKSVNNIKYKHFCGDIPDENWSTRRFWYDWQMVNRDRPNMLDLRKWLVYAKRLILQMLVWRFFGVCSRNHLQRKIKSLLENTCLIDGEKWIRWDSRGLYENEQYLDIFPKGTNIIVEYYPESHDPLGFVDFIKKLNNVHKGDQKFWISFDAGHFERARYLYPECCKISSEEWLFKFLNHISIASLIKMIEISNISSGGQNAHTSLFEGVVDFANIFAIVGQAIKKKKVYKPFFLVLEGTPLSFKEIKKFTKIKFRSYFEAMDDEDRFSKLKNKYL